MVKDFFKLTNLRALPTLGKKRQALYKLFAAYIHTIPLEELIESVERARNRGVEAVTLVARPKSRCCTGSLRKTQRLIDPTLNLTDKRKVPTRHKE